MIDDVSADDFRQLFELNVMSYFLASKVLVLLTTSPLQC
jgi:hypothetical protein